MESLPAARRRGIVVQELGGEILIYDLDTHKAYNLNETSSIVYQACDGKTTFDEFKRQNKFTDDLIFLALDQLKESNLIEDRSFGSAFNGVSRRETIRRVGLATMVALPVISSLVAPTAAMAQSCQANHFIFSEPVFADGEICGGDRDPVDQAARRGACDKQYGAMCCSGRATAVSGSCIYIPCCDLSIFACRCGAA